MLAAASGDSSAPNDLRRLGFSPSGALVCRTCFTIPREGADLQCCSGCKEAHYCGAACERADLGSRHKDECRKWKAAQAAQRAAMEAQESARERWLGRSLAEVRKAADKGDAAAQAVLRDCCGAARLLCRRRQGPVQVSETFSRVVGQGGGPGQRAFIIQSRRLFSE